MLLEDSIEFETTFPSNESELVPTLKWENIKLSNIWIPSHLLLSRLLPAQPSFDLFKPVINHTLKESNPVTDCFSTYVEADKEASSNLSSCEKLLDSLEDFPSSSFNSVRPEQISLGNELDNESCSSLKYSNRIKLVLTQIVNMLKRDYCLKDILPKCLSLIKQAVTSVIQDMDLKEYLELPPECFSRIELFLNQITNELEGDINFEEVCHDYLNILNNALIQVAMRLETNYFSPEVSPENFNKSEKNVENYSSLEESVSSSENCLVDLLCLSDEEEDISFAETDHKPPDKECQENTNKNFGIKEAETLEEINCDLLAKTNTSQLSGKEFQDSETPAEASFASSPEQLVDLVELSDKIWFQSQLESTKDVEVEIDSVSSFHNSLPCAVIEDELKITEDKDPGALNKFDEKEKEPIVNFSFTLQKSKEKDLSKEIPCDKKTKKEKKVKKKASKSIPLDNLFSVRRDTGLEPEFIDFYESLEKKHGHCHTEETNVFPESKSVFPSLPQQSETKKENYGDSCGIWDVPCFEQKTSCNETTNLSIIEPDSNAITFVIENLPLSVDEESLQSLVLQFGDLKQMVLKQCGKTFKAEVIMDLEDPNWIIECLNGNHPFGVSSGEGLKCYLKS